MKHKIAVLSGFAAISALSHQALANETLTDRCGQDVLITNWDEGPGTATRSILLPRAPIGGGYSRWTGPFTVRLSSEGQVRWWCHSTTGNWADPGTWNIKEITLGTRCQADAGGVGQCVPDARVKQGANLWSGWTAERSRCDSHTPRFSARIGPDRLLQMYCEDNIGTSQSNLSTDPTGNSVCANTIQGHIPWDYSGGPNALNWQSSNINTLCGAATNSEQPGWCFLHVMFDGINWGGGTQWDWQNAVNLCQGTRTASNRIGCFQYMMSQGANWQDASNFCVYYNT